MIVTQVMSRIAFSLAVKAMVNLSSMLPVYGQRSPPCTTLGLTVSNENESSVMSHESVKLSVEQRGKVQLNSSSSFLHGPWSIPAFHAQPLVGIPDLFLALGAKLALLERSGKEGTFWLESQNPRA